MKILLVGSNGQLGWELCRTCPEKIKLTALDYPEIDLCQPDSLVETIKHINPDWIINAAAYTAVDKAEKEKEKADQINHQAVLKIAECVKELNIRLMHISTDFVFDGLQSTPYLTNSTPNPDSVYGITKLEGEKRVLEVLKENALIIRTAWLYSSHGNNFVKSILRLLKEKDYLNIVDDQVGTPCWANGLGKTIWKAIDKDLKGIFLWTDAGVATWYDFAVAIQEEGIAGGILNRMIPINPIPTSKYPTPAKRPTYSVLDKTSFWKAIQVNPLHWRIQLRSMMKELI